MKVRGGENVAIAVPLLESQKNIQNEKDKSRNPCPQKHPILSIRYNKLNKYSLNMV